MKTSNKLLIGLLSFISLYIITGAIEVGTKRGADRQKKVNHSLTVPDFKFLVVENAQVQVNFASSSSFHYSSFEGGKIPEVKYHMEGDTLVVEDFDYSHIYLSHLEIDVKKDLLTGISANNAKVKLIANSDMDSLNVNINKSNFEFTAKEEEVTQQINNLVCHATEGSFVNVYYIETNHMDLSLSNTKMYGASHIDDLKVNLTDKSNLKIWDCSQMQLSRDSTSVIRFHTPY